MAAYIVSLLVLIPAVHAQGVKVAPFLTAVFNASEDALELGPEFSRDVTDDHLIVRSLLRFPAEEAGGATNARFTLPDGAWRLALYVGHEQSMTQENGPILQRRLSAEVSWGFNSFDYHPDPEALDDERTAGRHSFGAGLRMGWYQTEGEQGARQFSPQIRLNYDRPFKAAKEVGVIVPGDEGDPDTVLDLIREPPSAKPKLTLLGAVPFYGGDGPFAFGPAMRFVLSGEAGGYSPTAGSGRLDAEFWTYYFLNSEATTNVRFGVSPYVSVRTHGEDDRDRVEFGFALQLRTGGNLVEF